MDIMGGQSETQQERIIRYFVENNYCGGFANMSARTQLSIVAGAVIALLDRRNHGETLLDSETGGFPVLTADDSTIATVVADTLYAAIVEASNL